MSELTFQLAKIGLCHATAAEIDHCLARTARYPSRARK